MGNLSIILFLLGSVFLFLGWRWQNPPNEEAMTALKGLAYLKREILRVQDQVHILEDKIQTAQQIELKESVRREMEHREMEHREMEHREMEHREMEHREMEHRKIEHREMEYREMERKEKSKLYSLKTKEQRARISGGGDEPKRYISPKYQEVLELAAKGHRIPEIAQHLLLSQDAVMMVLQTQARSAAR